MRKYFEKLEKCRYLRNSVVGHGFAVWLETKLTPLILIVEDLKGHSVSQATDSDGSRTYKLDIALTVVTTRVHFHTSASTPRAIGVGYLFEQSLYRADPRAKVILPAGAYNTPQLLKLSGVGPRIELELYGFEVVKDLPGIVGNTQDRYDIGTVGQAPSDFTLLKDCIFLEGNDLCYGDWANNLGDLKIAYTKSGIALEYPHHSSEADNNQDLFLGDVPAYLMVTSQATRFMPPRM
ncbi:hypothetical protein BJ878DRAFT_535371 [Calycina marina]|uniref:Glucose-methanol-choline oxidoreductase N-terminal domain-containing protein n=1 Tax=Calycina marina TaxID=1763456 RepID=A0A9P8CE15_9HELO|nr:hypothetical protein BJ878DRAFT_535371 [Calycina marina]